MKKLTINNIDKYGISKRLKIDIKLYHNYDYIINKNDFDIIKKENFKNCYVYKYKDIYNSLGKTRLFYELCYFDKKIYNSFYNLNKDFGKNKRYFIKLKEYNKQKKYIENNNFYIDKTK